MDWEPHIPIYQQIVSDVHDAVLDGRWMGGQQVPSVRQCALELKVNPLTVAHAYRVLADTHILEQRRGVGMFVAPNAHSILLDQLRRDFLSTQWPNVQATIKRLGLQWEDLFKTE